ncbi:MAG: hypothetical protein KAW52_08670 [candidate division Zixibacteria bacterium]|nr:hypothetical protein [candidate division Zixibacteria bacterium]
MVSEIFQHGKNEGVIPKCEKGIRRLSNKKRQRIFIIRRLYDQLGTLQAVAEEVGITRERVRQIIVDGKELGLFKTVPSSRRREFGVPKSS